MNDISAMIAQANVPACREDLRLHAGPDGNSWLIYDPLAHRYHELDRRAFLKISNWKNGTTYEDLAAHLGAVLGEPVSVDDLYQFVYSLDELSLLSEPLRGWRSVHERREGKRQSPFAWLLHNYLFIRVPLVRPDGFLSATLPAARILASWPVLALVALLGVTGLYMTSRQWDVFTHTFLHFFSLEGLAGYFAALVGVKLLHELGHAYAAKHYGCRVPSMGIAFMVLAPMAYTDVSDAWRVPSKRARMVISAAGMAVELAVACIATFCWAFLPEGTLKSTAFFVATISWVMSLGINISPLMRFDGYYLLADHWGIPNLQSRAFALMRWWLREVLFGLGAECPEEWPRGQRIKVIVYAVIAALYRLVLFIGIAVFVYHVTIKLLGILLFAVEILWFVARPIYHELLVWWRIRKDILARRRVWVTGAVAAVTVLAALVPWPHRVEIPAVLEAKASQRIVAPIGAQLASINVQPGQRVAQGDVVVVMTSPKLDSDIAKLEIELELNRLRYARRTADQQDRDATAILERDLKSLSERLEGMKRLQAELVVRAANDGTVSDTAPDLHAGRWLARGEELATLTTDAGYHIRGYMPETLLGTLADGAEGVFVTDMPRAPSQPVRLTGISASGAAAIELAYLTSTQGGPIAVNEDRDRGAIPVEAQYQVVLALSEDPVSTMTQRGVVLIDATPESLARRIAKRALAILIRESGF